MYPGESQLTALIEGSDPRAATPRLHRLYDKRFKGIARMLLLGRTPPGVGALELTGVSANGETFTINGRVYELDPAGVAAVGDVAVTVADGANATVTAAAIVAAVNADTDGDVDALLLTAGGGSEVIAFISRSDVGDLAADGVSAGYALAETMTNADWLTNRSGNDYLDGEGSVRTFGEWFNAHGTHVFDAADVARLADGAGIPVGAIYSTETPRHAQFTCMTGSPVAGGAVRTLATVVFQWRQVNSNRWVLECRDGGAVLSAGDYLHWSVRV